MAFLKPDATRTEHGLVIKEKIIKDGSTLKPNRPLKNGKVEWITIHNTDDIREAAGTNDAEQYARATHNGNMNGVSVHYYIDETDCWQLLREDEMGYHAADGKTGPGNSTSLAIEIIMDGSGKYYDKEAEDRGALLAAILLHRHGLTVDKMVTHKHWYGKKNCPVYILPHWSVFVAKVSNYLKMMEQTTNATAETGGKGAKYIVQAGAFNKKEYAEALVQKLKSAGFDAVVRINGDVDADGKVTAADARSVLRKSVGLEE